MWLLRGAIQEVIDAESEDDAFTIYLRPEQTYTFGRRKEPVASIFQWPEKTVSRDHASIVVGPTSKSHIRITKDQTEPTYSLALKNESTKAWSIVRADGTTHSFEGQPKGGPAVHTNWDIKDGDCVSFTGTRKATFIWRPVDILISGKKIEELAKLCIPVGCRYLDSKQRTDEPFTHFVIKAVRPLKALPAEAVVQGAVMINTEFMERLARITTPRKDLPPSDSAYDGSDVLSLLERDFELHWSELCTSIPSDIIKGAPDEAGYIDNCAPQWFLPNAGRKSLFANILVINTIAELKHPATWNLVVERGGGRWRDIEEVSMLDSLDESSAAMQSIIAAVVPDDDMVRNALRILIVYDARGEATTLDNIRTAAFRVNAAGLVTLVDLVKALYLVDVQGMKVDADYSAVQLAEEKRASKGHAGASTSARDASVLAPASSAMDLDVPGLGPTPAPTATGQDAAMPPPPPPKKKLVRKAGQKDTLLDELWATSEPQSQGMLAARSSQPDGLGPTQASTLTGDASQPGASESVGSTRNSKLKRRAGKPVEHTFDFDFREESQPAPQSEPGGSSQAMQVDEPERPRKSQVPAKRKAVVVEEEQEEEGPRLAKDEAVTKKKVKAPAAAPAKEKSKKEEKDEREAEKKRLEAENAKYLQVDKGKRKVTAAEAELNKEFNELKIVRPALLAPEVDPGRKVTWRERDAAEDAIQEAQNGDYDPNDSFFNIIRAPLGRSRPAPICQVNRELPDEWQGRPNFKAFRPKTASKQLPPRPRQKMVELVLAVPTDYGLGDDEQDKGVALDSDDDLFGQSRSTAGKGRGAAKKTSKAARPAIISEGSDEEDDDAFANDGASTSTARSTNTKGKGKATKATAAAGKKGKNAAASKAKPKTRLAQEESDEEDDWNMSDIDELEEETDKRKTSASKGKTGAAKKQIITVESDDEDGLTFEGFTKKAPAKRKRA